MMSNQNPSLRVNNSADLPENRLTDQLFELASLRSLDAILHKALALAVRTLEAEAGSIFFQGHTPQSLRLGAFRPEALARIERWEEAISKRLADATWSIPSDVALPISISKLAENRLTNIPLSRESAVVGSLSLVLPPQADLSENQRRMLTQIAKAVGQMASLVDELDSAQQRLNRIGVFYQVSQALVTTFDINKLLADTMQLAANVIDAGASSIMLIDEQKKELVFEVSHGSHSKTLRQQRIPLDEGIAGWVAQHGHPVIANNARTDPRFSSRVDVRTGFLTQSIAAVPLKIKGRIIGVLEVLNKYSGAGFTHEDIQLMSSIATQAAIAIENSRLYQKVRDERDLVIAAQESMRREVADHLHDGPMRLLSALSTSLDHLERLNEIKPEVVHNEIEALRNLVYKAARDMRQISFEMHPTTLETHGLMAALEQYVGHLRATENFTIHFKPANEVAFDDQVAAGIFAIIQEAVNNVRHHAAARNLWLSTEIKDNHLQIAVRDDGNGFEVDQLTGRQAQGNALGLLKMHERAKSIGAVLDIESRATAPKRGTSVQLSLPLPESGDTEQ